GEGSGGAATGGVDSGGAVSPRDVGAEGDPAGGPGAGQPQQPGLLETLSPQQIRAWIIRRGSPGGGGYDAASTGAPISGSTSGVGGAIGGAGGATRGVGGTAGGAGGATGGTAGAGGAGGTAGGAGGEPGARGAGATRAGGTAGTGGAGGTEGAASTGGAGGTAGGAGGATGAGGAGAAGVGGAGCAASAGGPGVAGAGGATSTGGAGAAGAGGATGARGTGAAGAGAACAGGVRAAAAGDAAGAGGTGAAGAGGAGAAAAGGAGPVCALRHLLGLPLAATEFLVAGTTPPLLFPPTDQSQPQLLPHSPLPGTTPYTKSRAFVPTRLCRVRRPRAPAVPGTHDMTLRPSSVPLCVVLPSPPASSLPDVADPPSGLACASSPTVTRFLPTVVTDPTFSSPAASALVAELADFAAAYRLDYLASLLSDPDHACPPSVRGEVALGCDVLEDRQEELEYLAAAVPHLATMLLTPEGDPDALDILTLRSYREAISGGSDPGRGGTVVIFFGSTVTCALASCRRTIALGFAPLTAAPLLFLHTETTMPPFYVLVYIDNLVFSIADTEALALVKAELHKRHTCTDLGELRSYLGLQITWDRAQRTITMTQSHMVHQVLQRFGFQISSPQPTPLSTCHSLSAPPSDESLEPSGFLGSGSVSWRSTRSSSVLGSSCEAEIYVGAMVAQELRWLTYLLALLSSSSQRHELRLSYVALRANTADVFTKALGSACLSECHVASPPHPHPHDPIQLLHTSSSIYQPVRLPFFSATWPPEILNLFCDLLGICQDGRGVDAAAAAVSGGSGGEGRHAAVGEERGGAGVQAHRHGAAGGRPALLAQRERVHHTAVISVNFIHKCSPLSPLVFVLSQERLQQEVEEEVRRRGRVSLVDLGTLLNVDLFYCERAAKNILEITKAQEQPWVCVHCCGFSVFMFPVLCCVVPCRYVPLCVVLSCVVFPPCTVTMVTSFIIITTGPYHWWAWV
ncbi:unnamed protein product, partial [Closterium sp. NIES-54]